MIKRPLNSMFRAAVIAGKKTTTIRDKSWPVAVPIMLYNWRGAPYRSKHRDVAVIRVHLVQPLEITHFTDGLIVYSFPGEFAPPLWRGEGFSSQIAMDEWFREVVKPGQTSEKVLMHFCLDNPRA